MACAEVKAETTATEKDMDTAEVTCLVDGLQMPLIGKKPKNATVFVKFYEMGFDLEAKVKGKTRETIVRKVIKKLPGPIVPDKCTWKAETGKVVITLAKVHQESWVVQMSQRGLEQEETDD